MIDLNEADHPLDELLEDARMAAATDWEEEFMADQIKNRQHYGLNWEPTPMQIAKMRQIAGQAWLEDGYDR